MDYIIKEMSYRVLKQQINAEDPLKVSFWKKIIIKKIQFHGKRKTQLC